MRPQSDRRRTGGCACQLLLAALAAAALPQARAYRSMVLQIESPTLTDKMVDYLKGAEGCGSLCAFVALDAATVELYEGGEAMMHFPVRSFRSLYRKVRREVKNDITALV